MKNAQMHKKRTERTYKLSERVTTPSLDMYQKYKDDKTVQFSALFVRTYASVEEVERLLEVLNPDEYAYIVHDKDVTKEGEPKQPHIHLLMSKKSRMRLTKLLTFTEQASRVEVPRSKKYAYEYLTHKNDPDKVAYSANQIHEFHVGANTFAVTAQEARENHNLQLLDDITNLSRRQMAEKYGSDYIKNYQRYEAFMQVVKHEDSCQEVDSLVRDLKPTDELLYVSEADGDTVRICLADQVAKVFLDHINAHEALPDSREIVRIYYEMLSTFREERKRLSNALHIYESEVYDV